MVGHFVQVFKEYFELWYIITLVKLRSLYAANIWTEFKSAKNYNYRGMRVVCRIRVCLNKCQSHHAVYTHLLILF